MLAVGRCASQQWTISNCLTRVGYGVKAQSTSTRYLTSGHQSRSATGLYAGENIISMPDNFRIRSTFPVCAFIGQVHVAGAHYLASLLLITHKDTVRLC